MTFSCHLKDTHPLSHGIRDDVLPKAEIATENLWDVSIDEDFLPDLIEGFFVSGSIPIRVCGLSSCALDDSSTQVENHQPKEWIEKIKVSVTGRQFPIDQTTYDVAPGQVSRGLLVQNLTQIPEPYFAYTNFTVSNPFGCWYHGPSCLPSPLGNPCFGKGFQAC